MYMYSKRLGNINTRTIAIRIQCHIKHFLVAIEYSMQPVLRLNVKRKQITAFVFHFLPVVGCPDMTVSGDTHTKRDGHDKLLVICNHTGETSHFKCDGTQWRGELKNCTRGESERQHDLNAWTFSNLHLEYTYSHDSGHALFYFFRLAWYGNGCSTKRTIIIYSGRQRGIFTEPCKTVLVFFTLPYGARSVQYITFSEISNIQGIL